MNQAELEERLEIMKSSDVISEAAARVSVEAFNHLTSILDRDDLKQGEMLFTHLSTALTRLERGEDIETPPEALLQEAKDAGFSEKAEEQIHFIEEVVGQSLPQAEKDYLHLHYATVFQQNSGGIQA